jgi:hypothetical protein
MIRKKHLIAFIIMLLILPGTVWGADADSDRTTLQGIKGVFVSIKNIEPEIEKDGLTKSQIQTDVELKLRQSGLKVLSDKELLKTPGMPTLNVYPQVFKSSQKFYVYKINVRLFQYVYLQRNGQGILAPTWSLGHLGISTDVNYIRNQTKDYVDKFINAWLSVNQKK